jgi:hypothetical protein
MGHLAVLGYKSRMNGCKRAEISKTENTFRLSKKFSGNSQTGFL